jgi:hypothetical protein
MVVDVIAIGRVRRVSGALDADVYTAVAATL